MQKLSFRLTANPEKSSSSSLDQAIASQREAIDAGLTRPIARKLIVAGVVYVNGKQVRNPSALAKENSAVEIFWDQERTLPVALKNEAEMTLRILYEDDVIICFEKPAGLPTQPTLDVNRPNLFDMAKKQLSSKTSEPIYLGMHHRLDRDTSGVVLFTKAESVNAAIAEQFKDHLCEKTYVAVVHGKLKKKEGRIESFLGEVAKVGKQTKYGSVKSGGKKAITEYKTLAQTDRETLVEVQIQTGRTHQIRVHLSELGHPIVGDTFYGSPQAEFKKLKRFLLHARELKIDHPITKKRLTIESPLPKEFKR